MYIPAFLIAARYNCWDFPCIEYAGADCECEAAAFLPCEAAEILEIGHNLAKFGVLPNVFKGIFLKGIDGQDQAYF
jgi:hypothetical protein